MDLPTPQHEQPTTTTKIDGRAIGPDPEGAIRTCPNCGAALLERRCKLSCPAPGCGYYLSCADYY